MALLPPPPPKSTSGSANPSTAGAVGGSSFASPRHEPEIVVIPDKFYGAALKQKVTDVPVVMPKKPAPPPPPKPLVPMVPAAPIRHPGWPLALAVLLVVTCIGVGFVYLNRALLFQKPTPAPVAVPIPVLPSAAANVTTSLSGSVVALAWVDTSGNETGYRVERKEEGGTFIPLTNLASNSTAFLDVSVQAGKTYVYRVVAINDNGEQPSSDSAITTPPIAPTPAAAPTLPSGGLDSDSDGLSDVEEDVFGTDPHNPDTDHDGFLDGNEVFHLYNPAATAPTRLLDSGVVQLWQAPIGWSLLVPIKWTTTVDVPDGSRATIDTKHGEHFLISAELNPSKLSLFDWYLARHPGVLSSSLKTVTTKGGIEGILGIDRMDAYFSWGDRIFSLQYDLNGQPFINFRTTFEMMLNSLRLSDIPTIPHPSLDTLSGPGALVAGTMATSSTTSVRP